MRLVVDGAPGGTLAPGELFTVAVLVQDDDGEDLQEYEGVIRLEVEGPGALAGDVEVAAGYGEALFTDIAWEGACAEDEDVALYASAEAGSVRSDFEVLTVAKAAAAAAAADVVRNTPDALLPRACDPATPQTQAVLCLTTLKGALWNDAGNRAYYEAADAKALLAALLVDRFLDDAAGVVLVLTVLLDLLTFRGGTRVTCSRCHGTVPPGHLYLTTHDAEMDQPGGAPVVRSWMFECFLDAATQAPVFDSAAAGAAGAVLEYDMANHQPYAKGTAPDGAVPGTATVAAMAGAEAPAMCDAPLDAIFQAQFAAALRAVHNVHADDEYVVEKMQAVVRPLAALNPLFVSGVPPALLPKKTP